MHKARVLLVDDRSEFRQTLGERLQARGYQTLGMGSGAEALAAVQAQDFDAVVLDMVMPGMDGLETLRRLRQVRPALPVIVLTGYGTSEDVVQALALGARDYLVKPVDLDILQKRIDEATAPRPGLPTRS